VAKRSDAQRNQDLDRSALGSPQAGATTHDRFVKGTHSGRLVCRLTTKTPLVVGADQRRPPKQMGEIDPYLVDQRPAIPGSSLRGLIASLAEAASNSALRVLAGGIYSYRKPFEPKYTLSALGMIVKGAEGKLQLKPLALPTLEQALDGRGSPLGYFVVPPRFKRIFPKPALKVYMGDYNWVRKDNGYRTSPHERATCPWNVTQLAYNAQGNLPDSPAIHAKDKGRSPRVFAVAQNADGAAPPRDGYLRVLGCWGDRTSHIPEGKKHELWLPVAGPEVKAAPIDEKAIERFHAIADERTEDSLKARNPVMPFHPLDTARNQDTKELGQKFRLKAGDLVYFDVDEKGIVKEIALSAIWRGRVETLDGKAAGPLEFFEAVDPDLVPFHPGRKRITIAERMFGFVEDRDPKDEKNPDAGLGLAGRIRFSDGLLGPGVTKDAAMESAAVPLRILSSPKPPSPAMYFKPGKGPGAWVAKQALRPGDHHPQGRKMYLHHFVKEGTQPWKTLHPTENLEQKNRVRPVRVGQEFHFHIDFENLTDAELGLLQYAIAPDAAFHHKLGMGKPLGLGSVKIEVVEWRVVDRQKRYTVAGLRAVRHSEVRRPADVVFWRLRDEAITSRLVTPEVHRAICMLGNFAAAPPSDQIHTPTLADQPDAESETFQWFVANDSGRKERFEEIPKQQKSLQPLSEAGKTLPKLVRPDWVERQRR
jgi:CRISPR-associated protein (TIGR03986 family)